MKLMEIQKGVSVNTDHIASITQTGTVIQYYLLSGVCLKIECTNKEEADRKYIKLLDSYREKSNG